MRSGIVLLLTVAGLGACASNSAYAQVPAGLGYDAPYYDPAACWADGWSDLSQMPYCGWYDGFFYPGTGIYVYGHDRRPHVWSDGQQNYWSGRREQWHNDSTAGAREMLGGISGTGVSRPLQPTEMGGGMSGFGGGRAGTYGGHFGGAGGGGGFRGNGGGHSGRP
jgi:hypothetical protein